MGALISQALKIWSDSIQKCVGHKASEIENGMAVLSWWSDLSG